MVRQHQSLIRIYNSRNLQGLLNFMEGLIEAIHLQ